VSENTDVNDDQPAGSSGGFRRSRRSMRRAERAAEREAYITGQQPLLTRRELKRLREEAEALEHAVSDRLLERLDAERIRPDLVGLSRPGLDSALAMLGETHREGSWRELPNEEFFGRFSELFSAVEPLIRTPPLAPERGETGRIVAVLRRMPKQTVTRVTRVWNPLLLRIMISIGLRALRRAN